MGQKQTVSNVAELGLVSARSAAPQVGEAEYSGTQPTHGVRSKPLANNAVSIDSHTGLSLATVQIQWLGTHKEYDRIDVRTVQYAHKADQK